MDYRGTCDAVLRHCQEAGANLDNPITDVEFAAPRPTSSRCIRVFYGGETDPSMKMGGQRVLNGEMVAELLIITAFWSLSNLGEGYTRVVIDEIRALKHEIKTRIYFDSALGGKATDLFMSYADIEYSLVGGVPYAVMTIEVTTDYVEYPFGA